MQAYIHWQFWALKSPYLSPPSYFQVSSPSCLLYYVLSCCPAVLLLYLRASIPTRVCTTVLSCLCFHMSSNRHFTLPLCRCACVPISLHASVPLFERAFLYPRFYGFVILGLWAFVYPWFHTFGSLCFLIHMTLRFCIIVLMRPFFICTTAFPSFVIDVSVPFNIWAAVLRSFRSFALPWFSGLENIQSQITFPIPSTIERSTMSSWKRAWTLQEMMTWRIVI